MDDLTERQKEILKSNGIEYNYLDSISDDDEDEGNAISLCVTGKRTHSNIYYFVGRHNQILEDVIVGAIENLDEKEMINDFHDGCDNLYDTVMDILDTRISLQNALSELNGK